jgi:hypothetical protein
MMTINAIARAPRLTPCSERVSGFTLFRIVMNRRVYAKGSTRTPGALIFFHLATHFVAVRRGW